MVPAPAVTWPPAGAATTLPKEVVPKATTPTSKDSLRLTFLPWPRADSATAVQILLSRLQTRRYKWFIQTFSTLLD